MSKELEFIRMYIDLVCTPTRCDGKTNIKIHLEKEFDKVTTALETLEIIKKHKLLNYVLKNKKCAKMYHLEEYEINLLKEMSK